MEKAIGNVLIVVFGVVGALALVASKIVWNGYVFHILWGWLVVPVFGVPPLSLAAAIGLLIVLEATRSSRYPGKDEHAAKTLALSFLAPLVSLGAGYIVHLYL